MGGPTSPNAGPGSPVGERLRRVRALVEGAQMFLAEDADVLTDIALDAMIEEGTAATDTVGALVPPQSGSGCVAVADESSIRSITTLQQLPIWKNGGHVLLRPEIVDHIPEESGLIAQAAITAMNRRTAER